MSNENDETITTDEALERYEDSGESFPPEGTGETGPTMSSESIRLPEHVVEYYEKQANRRGLGKTTMMRVALMEWMEDKQNLEQFSQPNSSGSNPTEDHSEHEGEDVPDDPYENQTDASNKPTQKEPTKNSKQDEETPGTART